ncbi:hypothetical protein WBG78_04295 [Chryseolinea sp. T2]|uniref:hypothetical protein n=1 Tax=Chryseolinea sp. T2 TaxID=3129255 RepID=UPI0030770E0D
MRIKKLSRYTFLLFVVLGWSCVENDLDVYPNDENFPLQLVLDADEGADLADAEDYGLEVAFADHIGDLPGQALTLHYVIEDLEEDMAGSVMIEKVIYEYEDDDCVFERELEFSAEGEGTSGTITLHVDEDLKTVPESFEIVFKLPGKENTEGSFSFTLSDLSGGDNVILGAPLTFEYEVLDSDVAGEWKLELDSEEAFEKFKAVFGPLNSSLEELSFEDITGEVTAEFEFGEMKFVVELAEEEEVITCEDGETETEMEHLEIEIEADYEAEDGELSFEGSHFILGDDGEVEDELDFQIEATYDVATETMTISFLKVIDEDHFEDGDELYAEEGGAIFTFEKD